MSTAWVRGLCGAFPGDPEPPMRCERGNATLARLRSLDKDGRCCPCRQETQDGPVLQLVWGSLTKSRDFWGEEFHPRRAHRTAGVDA